MRVLASSLLLLTGLSSSLLAQTAASETCATEGCSSSMQLLQHSRVVGPPAIVLEDTSQKAEGRVEHIAEAMTPQVSSAGAQIPQSQAEKEQTELPRLSSVAEKPYSFFSVTSAVTDSKVPDTGLAAGDNDFAFGNNTVNRFLAAVVTLPRKMFKAGKASVIAVLSGGPENGTSHKKWHLALTQKGAGHHGPGPKGLQDLHVRAKKHRGEQSTMTIHATTPIALALVSLPVILCICGLAAVFGVLSSRRPALASDVFLVPPDTSEVRSSSQASSSAGSSTDTQVRRNADLQAGFATSSALMSALCAKPVSAPKKAAQIKSPRSQSLLLADDEESDGSAPCLLMPCYSKPEDASEAPDTASTFTEPQESRTPTEERTPGETPDGSTGRATPDAAPESSDQASVSSDQAGSRCPADVAAGGVAGAQDNVEE